MKGCLELAPNANDPGTFRRYTEEDLRLFPSIPRRPTKNRRYGRQKLNPRRLFPFSHGQIPFRAWRRRARLRATQTQISRREFRVRLGAWRSRKAKGWRPKRLAQT